MVRLKVPGMTCGGCARSITNAVKSVDPAAQVQADVSSRTVTILTDAEAPALRKAIKDAGYEAEVGVACGIL